MYDLDPELTCPDHDFTSTAYSYYRALQAIILFPKEGFQIVYKC